MWYFEEEKKEKCDNLNDSEKEQLRKYKKEVKKVMRYDFDDEKNEHFKKEDNRRKKEKCDNLDDNEREQIKNKDNKRKRKVR